MSSSSSLTSERRLSANARNAYIIVSSPNNKNPYDPQQNKNYLTAKPTNERSPLSNKSISAPICEENSAKENLNKQTASVCVKKINAEINKSDIINPTIPNSKEKSPQISSDSLVVKNTGVLPKNKGLVSSESSVKILTGMDRYITITKRKSSPRKLSLEPNPKQPKNIEVSQNRFLPLQNLESENISRKSPKDSKPPPLYLREPTTNGLVSSLLNLLGKENFHVVSLRKGNVSETKIQTYNEKYYRLLVNSFDADKKSYYTYQLKSAKGLVVIIKGIDSSVPSDEIKDALASEGFEVKSIHNILNKNKIPQPLFRVEITFDSSQMKKKADTHPIYGLRYLLNRRITVEEPIKRKGPPQCLNCQEFGHTRSFCRLPPVCVRCGDVHKRLECPYSNSENNYKKCSNCGENHTANYRGCRVYKQLMEFSKKKRPVYAQYEDSYFPSLPIKDSFSVSNVSSNKTGGVPNSQSKINEQNKAGAVSTSQIIKVGSGIPKRLKQGSIVRSQDSNSDAHLFSYAQALKMGSEVPTSFKESDAIPDLNTQSSIEKLINNMNNFMANMQNMFQQLMQNQSMLMQILLSKK